MRRSRRIALCNDPGMLEQPSILIGATRMLSVFCLDVIHCWCWFELQHGEVLGHDAHGQTSANYEHFRWVILPSCGLIVIFGIPDVEWL